MISTGSASGVTQNGATLNGTIDPQGLTTTAYYQYGTTTSYGSQTASQSLPGNLVPNPGCATGDTTGWGTGGTAPATFASQTGWASVGPASCRFTTATIPSNGYSEVNVVPYMKNISAGAQYNIAVDLNVLSITSGQRVVLYVTWRDSSGNGLSKVQVQATKVAGLQSLSGTLTAPANATQAQVNVTVENAGAADLYFDNVTLLAAGSGLPQAVTAQLSNLTSATPYHYRLVATSSQGTTYGPDQTFTTPSAPTATTSAATQVTYNGATLNASVNPNGDGTTVYFQYGPDTLYGSATPAQNLGSGSSAQAVSAPVSGLASTTVYHYRVVATNGVGTTYGADQIFTTANPPDTTPPSSSASSPALSNSSGWSVSYTASDNQGGSGLAEVDLYAKAPGDSGYSKVASDTSGNGAGSFSYTASKGDGSYSFYTIATDNAGNTETAPNTPDATTVLDTTAPSSSAGALPPSGNSTSLTVTYTASDSGSGLAEVDLYAKAPGDSGYSKVASDTSGNGSGSFSYTASKGDGSYSFYTIATDNAGNTQTAPNTPNATTLLDTVAPTATATSPATAGASFNVSYTASDNPGGSGLARVDLYAKAPGDTGYTPVASDNSGHTSGSFNYTATAGSGTYSFYTIAWDNAGNTQTTPTNPQTTTIVSTAPPVSSAFAPTLSNSTSVQVSFTASAGGSGLAEVDLYAKAPGDSGYSKVASDTSGNGSGSFSYTASKGDGSYSFYTIATDNAGNTETAPNTPDATTVLDTTAPSSSAGALPPSGNSTSLTVAYTASDSGSGLAEVDLTPRRRATPGTPRSPRTPAATARAASATPLPRATAATASTRSPPTTPATPRPRQTPRTPPRCSTRSPPPRPQPPPPPPAPRST